MNRKVRALEIGNRKLIVVENKMVKALLKGNLQMWYTNVRGSLVIRLHQILLIYMMVGPISKACKTEEISAREQSVSILVIPKHWDFVLR